MITLLDTNSIERELARIDKERAEYAAVRFTPEANLHSYNRQSIVLQDLDRVLIYAKWLLTLHGMARNLILDMRNEKAYHDETGDRI